MVDPPPTYLTRIPFDPQWSDMFWLAWRQVRAQTWITTALLIAAGVALAVTGAHLASLWRDSGAATCHGSCAGPISSFLGEVSRGKINTFYDATTITIWLAPALFGLFWGAPMIARELEAGTHHLAWNQSVSRTRWLATKLLFASVIAAATVGALVIAVTLWAHHLDRGTQLAPKLFESRGIAPVAYAIFAVVLGATVGLLLRRTVPAMAVTLAGYVLAVAAMPLWIRRHLLAPQHTLAPLDVNRILSLRVGPGMPIEVTGEPTVSGWILSNHTVAAGGQPFHALGDPTACGADGTLNSCQQWIGTLKPYEALTYHPLSSFWPLQFIESGVFLLAAAALAVFCLRRLRRIA